MTTFTQIILLILIPVLGWFLYSYIRKNPQAFSRENLGNSFFTLGILALILIAFIAICVWGLKNFS
jgi:hypothetical protein